MSMLRCVISVLVALCFVTGCGVDEGDVEDLERLARVTDASSSCQLGACQLYVKVSDAARDDELGQVMDAARAIEASTTEITVGSTQISFALDYDGSTDAPAIDLALDEPRLDGVDTLSVSLTPGGASIEARSTAPRDVLWDTSREIWQRLEGVADRSLSATSSDDQDGRNRVAVSDTFPSASIQLVQGLELSNLLTGVDVQGDRVRLGTSTPHSAQLLEDEVENDPLAAGLDVEVVLATNVLEHQSDRGGDEGQVRAMVEAVQAVDGVTARVEGATVRARADVASLEAIAAAIEAVRREQPEVGDSVPITVDPGTDRTIELGTTGSPDLLILADLIGAVQGVSEIEIRTPTPDRDRPEPPEDTDASISITIEGEDLSEAVEDDLSEAVQDVAAQFGPWDTTVSSLSVYVRAVDPEGREAGVPLRVDLRDGTWVPSTLDRGTPEQVQLGVRAWRAAEG